MCNDLKHNSYFKIRSIKVEKDSTGGYLFYLSKNKNPFELRFNVKQEEKLIESGILDYKLIDGYEAIYSPSKKIIECQLSLNQNDYESLCDHLDVYSPIFSEEGEIINLPPNSTDIMNDLNFHISIGYCSNAFSILQACKGLSKSERDTLFTLVISEIQMTNHKEAIDHLTKIGFSTLFSIANDLQINIVLINDQPTRDRFWSYRIDEDRVLRADADLLLKITKYYDIKPLSYFLNANKCSELPFYQFLQYYHCLEFYFTIYAGSRFKNDIIKEISTHTLSNTDYSNIETALENLFNKSKGFAKEIECLKDVFFGCLDANNINSYINTRRNLKSYFLTTKNYSKISSEEIKDNNCISLNKLARRIYDIRNSIAHAKLDEKRIEPNYTNIKLINNDIRLIRFIAEQVLKKNSQ